MGPWCTSAFCIATTNTWKIILTKYKFTCQILDYHNIFLTWLSGFYMMSSFVFSSDRSCVTFLFFSETLWNITTSGLVISKAPLCADGGAWIMIIKIKISITVLQSTLLSNERLDIGSKEPLKVHRAAGVSCEKWTLDPVGGCSLITTALDAVQPQCERVKASVAWLVQSSHWSMPSPCVFVCVVLFRLMREDGLPLLSLPVSSLHPYLSIWKHSPCVLHFKHNNPLLYRITCTSCVVQRMCSDGGWKLTEALRPYVWQRAINVFNSVGGELQIQMPLGGTKDHNLQFPTPFHRTSIRAATHF